MHLDKNQRVAIIGSSKSALDTATWAVKTGAKSVDLLLFMLPYAVPRYQDASGDKVKSLIKYNRIFCRALSWLMPRLPSESQPLDEMGHCRSLRTSFNRHGCVICQFC